MPLLPMIVAHRGASADAPENTLAAFDLAWEQDADAVECDIWMTADGHLVCHHDATMERTAGVSHRITETPLALLRELDVGAGKGHQIPLLAEVLEARPEGKKIFIEIKDSSRVLGPLAEVLEGTEPGQALVIAFDREVLLAARDALPEVPRLWLNTLNRDADADLWYPSVSDLVTGLQEMGAQGLDLRGCAGVTEATVQALRTVGAELHVWTVDDGAAACRFARMGVASITTNRPSVIREALLDL